MKTKKHNLYSYKNKTIEGTILFAILTGTHLFD